MAKRRRSRRGRSKGRIAHLGKSRRAYRCFPIKKGKK